MSQARTRRTDRQHPSRYRRQPQVEALEPRVMAGEMLTGLWGIAASLRKRSDEAFDPSAGPPGLYRGSEQVDLWISGQAANRQMLDDQLWAMAAAASTSAAGGTAASQSTAALPGSAASPVEISPAAKPGFAPMPLGEDFSADIFPLTLAAPSAAFSSPASDAGDSAASGASLSMRALALEDTGAFAASAPAPILADSDPLAFSGSPAAATTLDATTSDGPTTAPATGGGAAAASTTSAATIVSDGGVGASGGSTSTPWNPGSQTVTGGGPVNYVVNWNDGLTLSPGAVEYQSEGDSVDLRAQVAGKQVSSYSWDTSAAPTAGNISGASTYQLKLRWSNIYSGSTVDNRIRLTVNYTDQTQAVTDYNFRVLNDNTAGGSGGGAPVSATWSEVVAPDKLARARARAGAGDAVVGDRYMVDSVAGQLDAVHTLPSYGPAGVPLAIAYNSEAAAPKPIFLDHYQLDPARGIPGTVSAKLTFNGAQSQEYYYDTSAFNPGDILQIALQADARSLATGRYSWRIDVVAHYSTDVASYTTGTMSLVNRSSSAIGPGWQLAGLERISAQSDGVLLDLGGQGGGNRVLWFAWNASTQTYTTPAGDFSALVKNANNTFTRTLKSGEQINYDTAGRMTSIVDLNSNSTAFTYDGGGKLTGITDPNSRATTLAYTNGWLSSITDPASRATAISRDGNNRITGITEPDSTAWSFSYDAAGSDGRMTGRTDPRSKSTTFTYNTFGRISAVARPDNTSDSLSTYQSQGLLAAGTGTQGAPGAAVLLAAAAATYTDGRSQAWNKEFDWNGFGLAMRDIDPSSNLAVTHRDANGLAWMQTDTLARNDELFRDSKGNVTSRIRPDYLTESWTYNSYSSPTQYTDAASKVTSYTYGSQGGSQGNLTQITLPTTKTRQFSYTSDGLVATSTDELSRVTKYSYDSQDRLTTLLLPDGTAGNDNDNPRQTFTYDTYGNPATATDELSRVTTLNYNSMNRMTSQVLPDATPGNPNDNPVYTLAYDNRGNVTSQTDPLSHVTSMTYDGRGRVLTVTQPDPDGAGSLTAPVTTMAYDAEGNLTSSTDPLSHVTTQAFNAVGYQTSATDPLNHTASQNVDAGGQVTAQIDPLSNQTTYNYTAQGQVSQVTDPTNGVTLSAYSAQGWLSSQQQSGGGTKSYTRDDLGRVTRMTDELGKQTNFVYDDAGNLTRKTDPLSNVTNWAYDLQNRMISTTDPLNHTTTYTYDVAGNLTSETDPLNHQKQYEYNAQNQRTKIIDEANNQTVMAYDLRGRLTSVTDAASNVTAYSYDNLDRLVTETDAANHARSFTYNAVGQLSQVQDRLGQKRAFTFDNAGRTTAENWVNAQGTTVRTVSYTYDNANRLTGITDPSATYAYAYDADGRLTSVNNTGTPSAPQLTLSFGYNTRDDRTSLSDNRSGSVAYTYDAAHRLTQAQMSVTGITTQPRVTLGYNDNGLITSLNRSNAYGGSGGGVTVTSAMTYDADSRVTAIAHTSGANTLASYALTWNSGNQLTREVSGDGTADFTYNTTSQITAVSGWRSESYTLDALGNRTNSGYWTGTGNRLASDGTFNYSYDNEGNLLTKTEIATSKVTEYTWDYRNRLTNVKVKSSGGTVLQETNYTVDPVDNRIGVSFDSDGAGSQPAVQTWTSYDGLNPYADFNGSGSLTTRYLYGNGVDQLFGRMSASGTAAWYLTDHLGSVRDIANTSGTVIDHIKYDSFGKVISESSPSNGDRFKYTGRELDQNGLYYYRARYYDAAIGRFLAEDPLRFQAGDANFYRYVGNRPTFMVDPTGKEGEDPRWPPPGQQGSGHWEWVTRVDCTTGKTWNEHVWVPDPPTPAGMGNYFGFPPEFWRWYHKLEKGPGVPDLPDYRTVKEHYDEWKEEGKPDAEGHRTVRPEPLPDDITNTITITPPSKEVVQVVSAGVILYWIISVASRAIPIRNAIPVP